MVSRPPVVSTVTDVLTVVLYGNSLALSGVGASLEDRAGLRDRAGRRRGRCPVRLEPDVVVFDLAAARPDVVALWKTVPARPADWRGHARTPGRGLLRESSRALTADELLRVIENGTGAKVKGERS